MLCRFLRNPFKLKNGSATVNSRGAKAIRQQKIDDYYNKKKGASTPSSPQKTTEVEGREPQKEDTTRPETAEQPMIVKNPSQPHQEELATSGSKGVSSTDAHDATDGEVPPVASKHSMGGEHIEEKKTDLGEPETILPPRLSESKSKDSNAHLESKSDMPESEDVSPSSSTAGKKNSVESRDPPPHSTPDMSFCGCFN